MMVIMVDNPLSVTKDVLETEVVKAATLKPAEVIGNGFSAFFNTLFTPVYKWEIRNKYSIQKYEEEIKQKYLAIPEDQRLEPKLNIVGPALEASKYHIEEEEIRSMFANLIASSMNTELASKTHPAFVEIIKQLTPLEAKLLKFLIDSKRVPVGQIVVIHAKNTEKFDIWINNIFPFEGLNKDNFIIYTSAIDNLKRLALIEIDMNKHYDDEKLYEQIYNHDFFRHCVDVFENDPEIEEEKKLIRVELRKGIWNITDLGERFANCCF
jgi:Abortive infection alpha